MKWARIDNGIVAEIIPDAATVPSVAHWYGEAFAALCVQTPDEVEQRWTYDAVAGTFAAPVEPSEHPEETRNALKAKLAETDYQIIKCSEYQLAGLELPYDVAALHAERQAIRDQINALEEGGFDA